MATRKQTRSVTDPYAEFVQKLRLSGLGLDAASASLRRNEWAAAMRAAMSITRNMEITEKVLSLAEGTFSIEMYFEMKEQREENEDPVLLINGTYSAVFGCDGTPSEEFVRQFASREAKIIFWPYIRQHIADMSARMSIHNILLPLTSELSQQQNQTAKQ